MWMTNVGWHRVGSIMRGLLWYEPQAPQAMSPPRPPLTLWLMMTGQQGSDLVNHEHSEVTGVAGVTVTAGLNE